MSKDKQHFLSLFLKQNILTISPYADYDIIAALRHLLLNDVILFPAAYLQKREGNKTDW